MQAAREASQLTDKLLSFERASGADMRLSGAVLDFGHLIQQVGSAYAASAAAGKMDVLYDKPKDAVWVRGESVMLREAILNLITNAATHGGPDLTRVSLHLQRIGEQAVLTATDDGVGIPADKHIAATSRYQPSGGRAGQWARVADLGTCD